VNTQATTEPNDVTTTTTYDARGQMVSEQTGSIDATTYVYDDAGNPTDTIDPSGAETISHYDALGNESETMTTLTHGSPDAYATTTNHYDDAGNLTSVEGPRPNISDDMVFTYDGAGNLLTAQQAGISTPNTTTYTYDDANELVKVDQPLVSGTTFERTFTYDANGNQLTSTDSRGTLTNTYDNAGRLLTESLPNSVGKTHTYDAQGNELSVVATKTGFASATRSYTYDLAGNMTEATQGSRVIDLTFDSDGRLTQTTTDAGATSTRTYNATTGDVSSETTVAGTIDLSWNSNGLLSGVEDPFTTQTTNYTWDSAGRLSGRTDPAGLTWDRTYDDANRVDTQTITKSGTALASFDLGYDAASNVTSRAETVKTPGGSNLTGSGTWTYTYDGANRMITATDPSSVTTTYGYDAAGNRNSVQVGNGTAVTTTYDSASLPTSSSDGMTYGYDAMGTLTTTDKSGGNTGDRCYAYDAFGMLAALKKDSTTGCGSGTGDVTWAYDALGRITSRVGAATTTDTYGFDSSDLVREVIGSATTLYAVSAEGPLASSSAGVVRFFTKDLHGDIVGSVNASGTVTGSKLYSPWGEPAASSGEATTLGFQSQPTDADTGFVKTDTRLYDPTGARFTSRDVLFGDTNSPAAMNQYGYGEGNPITASDASGMYVCGTYLTIGSFRNANNPKVRACIERHGTDNVKFGGQVLFKANDTKTKWYKIYTKLQTLDNSQNWVAVPGWTATGRWCGPSFPNCGATVDGDMTKAAMASNTTTDDNQTKGTCGGVCFRSIVTSVELWDKRAAYGHMVRPLAYPGPAIP
jgi:RHS repeat-associated protein